MNDLEALDAQILELQEKAKALRNEKRSGAVAEVLKTIATYNISVNELFPGGVAKKVRGAKSSSPATIKFRGPKGEEWSGRGLIPRWMATELSAGKTKESFKV